MNYYSAVWIERYLFVLHSEGRRAVTDSFSNTEELLAYVQGQQMMENGDAGYR